ncbi:MAG: Kelch repeat-containing protein [Methanobacteriota archaeon]
MRWRRSRAALLAVTLVAFAGCVADEPASPPPGPVADPLSWRAHPDAPTPRTEVAVAVSEGRIFVLGGFGDRPVATDLVEVFDPATDRWSAGPSYPLMIHHVALVSHEDALYAFGGYVGSMFVPTSLAFRLPAGGSAWEPIAPLPRPRGAHAGAVEGGKVYLVGGVGVEPGPDALRAPVDVYDIERDAWAQGPELPTPREHLAAAAVGGTVHAVGGRMLSLSTNTGLVDGLDPAAGDWAARPPMPTARGGIAAAAHDGRLVVVGGESPDGTFAEVEAYDPGDGTWSRLPDLPTPRHGLGAVSVGGRLFVMLGGPEPGFTISGNVESLGT